MKKAVIFILTVACLLAACAKAEITHKDVLTEEDTIRVMSFNVCGWNYKKIKKLVPQLILEYNPDVVGVQECTYDWYKQFAKELPGYGFVGVGRDTGTLDRNCGEMVGILYRTDKYTLVDSGTFWLSETPETPSLGWDADYIRTCVWAVLQDNGTGRMFAHVNAHLENIDDGTGMEALEKGTQMVVDKARELDMPVILTGDMNFEKDTQYHNTVTAAGFLDAQDAAEITMEGNTYHGNGEAPEEHIDYIFLRDIGTVETYKIVHDTYNGSYPSDHYPIYADVKINK